jgi:hypothetical protein
MSCLLLETERRFGLTSQFGNWWPAAAPGVKLERFAGRQGSRDRAEVVVVGRSVKVSAYL